ncbi:GumC family protein [Spirosoma utsteinense]|uniref:Capsular exopolysaccharide synthesis family protein n=1 Tax=Spirosoma utsteinense TaxID=2585773 RepID=A0ABR6W949_9BACT|nr:tyrosine-protein kinase family protein [Spirosoma utsteinense]MBC3787708.1 capsular exopolysaccharide synthesis family protein [Spirosoma utsteinense]MBC3792688.1 capsular exopolysaccharide synthesis family protein [Spirosoma utsteinense]
MSAKSNYSYVPYQVVDSSESNVRTHLAPYVRNWPWYVLTIGLALAGAYVYLLYKQPIYRIQASLLLQDEKKGNAQASPLKELDVYNPKKVVENELEVLRSNTLMERVVADLHLENKYFHSTSFGKREIYNESPVLLLTEAPNQELYKKPLSLSFVNSQSVRINEKTYPLNQSVQTPYGKLRVLTRRAVSDTTAPIIVQAMPRTAAIGTYLSSLKAEPTSKTSTVIHLTIEDAVPQKGEAILNSLIKEYNHAAIVDKNKVASNTLRFVEDRLQMVSGELSSVEKRVETYKSSQGITNLSEQAQSLLQKTQQNDAQLNQVNIQLATLNDLQKFISNQSGKRGGTPATVGLNDPVLLGQIEKLSTLQLQRDNLTETTSEENPMLQTLEKQIKATKENVGQNIESMKTMLESSQQQYQAKNESMEGVIRSIPQQERTLLDITRQQGIKNNLYTYLLQKREELAVSFAAAISDSRTIDAAQSSDSPIKPVGIVFYALFGLVGLLVPTAAIASKGALNTRVMRRGDVEEVTNVPILGEVMHKRQREALVVAPNNRSVIAEQIRTIRTNLHIGQSEDASSRVLLFTSSMSGEGKSFISLNLGASLAMLKQPTVILEMDMRMPRLHQVFDVNNNIGLSDYLNDEATLDDILKPVPGYPNYFIIPSGPLPPDPSELLSGPQLKQLLAQLRERFKTIIIDAPPIGIVTDAQIIAPFADATLFVIRHGVTPKHSLKILDTLHREQRFQNLNIILNSVGGSSDAYHFSSRYKNSYSYR